VSDAHGATAVFSSSGLATRFALERAHLEVGDGQHAVLREPMLTLPEALSDHIVRCNVERVSIPTFDEVDGATRELHAFYLTPQNPPDDAADRLVRITAFYGGGNSWSNSSHILCAAGIATLSPAVRGSWGFGAEFAALNDGDLGGDEIVDLFHVARGLETNHGYTPDQIGLTGGSHGGYAVMRAMTFPPETNGHDDSYPFGFGTSHAGFSNILTFYEECVIPDWVVLEAGNPDTEADKLLDRSPISHVERLNAPLLLTHGTNDMRVPFAESATFAEAAEALDKPVTLVAFEGQGHGISGLDNVLAYYSAVFAFYETLIVD
jgi:dipeptidyl aminopeptidase/acylaminoacyl peptidase